jgi:hypothetical protein
MTKKTFFLFIIGSFIIVIFSFLGCDKLPFISPEYKPTVVDMKASLFGGYPYLQVFLDPKNAKSGQLYLIDLYDKPDGMFRERKNITFTQPQVNVGEAQSLTFTLTEQERATYAWRNDDWWKSCFIVKVNETIPDDKIRKPVLTNSQTPQPLTYEPVTQIPQNEEPTLSIVSPNGGEIWNLGQTVTINWTSLNYSGFVKISLSYDSGENWYLVDPGVQNTGSSQLLVISNFSNEYRVSTNCRLKLEGVGSDILPDPAISASDFTIKHPKQ